LLLASSAFALGCRRLEQIVDRHRSDAPKQLVELPLDPVQLRAGRLRPFIAVFEPVCADSVDLGEALKVRPGYPATGLPLLVGTEGDTNLVCDLWLRARTPERPDAGRDVAPVHKMGSHRKHDIARALVTQPGQA
jgi:hypothetical protein